MKRALPFGAGVYAETVPYAWAEASTSMKRASKLASVMVGRWTITPVVKFECRAVGERKSVFSDPYDAVDRCISGHQRHYSFAGASQSAANLRAEARVLDAANLLTEEN